MNLLRFADYHNMGHHVYINVDKIHYISGGKSFTTIYFDNSQIMVSEPVERVLTKLKTQRIAN